jgi:hypothetical protein
MKVCFVSVNGPRETYFVDEPRTFISVGNNFLSSLTSHNLTGLGALLVFLLYPLSAFLNT